MPNPHYTDLSRTRKLLLGTWLLIAILACTDAWWMHKEHICLSVTPVLDAIFVLGGMYAVFLYGHVQTKKVGAFSITLKRQRQHLPNAWFMAQITNQFAWGGLCIITLSYLGLSLNRPFIDESLLGADKWMGFDWYRYLDWAHAHPWIAVMLRYSYHSMLAEMALLIALLGITHQYAHAQRYVLLFLATAFICVIISIWWPSLGIPEHQHFNINYKYSDLQVAGIQVILRDIFYMRNHGQILPDRMQGLITFPSFHTAFAVIAIYAVKNVNSLILRYILIGLNILMILSTPIYGWHYLADVVGGVLVALVCISGIVRLMPEKEGNGTAC